MGGNRIGTAEIESALLLDCSRVGSPVRQVTLRGDLSSCLPAVAVCQQWLPHYLALLFDGLIDSMMLIQCLASKVELFFFQLTGGQLRRCRHAAPRARHGSLRIRRTKSRRPNLHGCR